MTDEFKDIQVDEILRRLARVQNYCGEGTFDKPGEVSPPTVTFEKLWSDINNITDL
jgi:hypothetical protein